MLPENKLTIRLGLAPTAERSGRDVWKSGQTTSYCTGDDGNLQQGAGAAFLTLSYPNVFGNTNRFTDELGGQTYTKNIVIDWSTYNEVDSTVRGYYRTLYGSVTMEVSGGTTSAITACEGTSITGFTTGWYMANYPMINSLIDMEALGSSQGLNYSPFNHSMNNSANSLWTNSSISSTNAVRYSTVSLPASTTRTTASRAMATRIFTWNDTTLT